MSAAARKPKSDSSSESKPMASPAAGAQPMAGDHGSELRLDDWEAKARILEQQLQEERLDMEALSRAISHDLRAPLRSIESFSELIADEFASQLDPEGKHYLEIVRKASRNLDGLIESLLQFSRATRGEINPQEHELSSLAQEILGNLQKEHPERKVEIRIAPSIKAYVDGHLIRVVLRHLLGNAWKFTGPKADAFIEFGAEQRQGETAWFVRDNGVGFEMARAHKLFQPFQRLHLAVDFPGNGIGLATVRRIISRHGGKVFGEGTVNTGATFWFTLPRR